MAEQQIHIIDDRKSNSLQATTGNRWRLIADDVMGGVSDGRLTLDEIDGRACLRMQGEVRLENNGGFLQVSLDLSVEALHNIAFYTGIVLETYGNGETYNLHLRTRDMWLPWQSYRAAFRALPTWQVHYLPFNKFEPHRIRKEFDIALLERIGLVAIGRAFKADVSIASVGLYR